MRVDRVGVRVYERGVEVGVRGQVVRLISDVNVGVMGEGLAV